MPKSDLVLLALDDAQILKLFERALAAGSYKVSIARDKPAIDKVLQESSPALVIVADQFAGTDGLETAQELIERFPTMPVLLFLHQEDVAILRQAMHCGVSDCLCPPLKIEDITTTVERSIKRAYRIGDWTRREVRRTTASLQNRVKELIKLETIINHIEDGVVILDENRYILMINPAARRAFGLRQEEDLIGKPMLQVVSHGDLRSLLNPATSEGMPHHEIVFDDGRVLSAQYTSIPGVGMGITLQDISYLKQIDRLKSEFVHNVSHDLRSPLTAILGYIDLLDRVGPVNDAQREFIQRVQISVQSITALVNDLLELGRIEAGIDGQKETIPLDTLIRDTVEDLKGMVAEKRQRLHLDIPAKVPEIRGNPIRLRQMLDNLIANAIKYTPDDGDVTVELERQEEQIILRIADTGVGIPPADQLHIFDKFYRASNVPKGVGGSGLGLAIVKSIIDNHHGRIWVESVLDQGSTFVIVLPIFKQQDTPAAQS
ncbi:MAG: PAS domain-containing protein [Anaerolineales bacterium]|nr:PAS domain-containing protein [Anaerolineales bacterium]